MNNPNEHKSIVMVTGGNGFVGKRLVSYLSNRSIPVLSCVRDITPGFEYPELVFSNGDIGESTDWSGALDGVDSIVHTAARVHVMDEKSLDPIAEFRRINVSGTVNLARQAAEAGVRRFIYLSSVKVSGESSESGCAIEASDPTSPRGPYAISKNEAEIELIRIAEETDLEIVIIRPPLIYGPGVKANLALLIRLIKFGLPLPFGNMSSNLRSLVSLDNLVDFIVVCLKKQKAANEIFMISDGEDVSTADLVRRIAKIMNKNCYLIPLPIGLLHDVARFLGNDEFLGRLTGNLQVDITKNLNLLDWRPKISLDEGLSRTLNDIHQSVD